MNDKKKILIIEDDVAIYEALRVLLESKDFEVHVIEDGDDAAAVIAEITPDLVILDLYLPGEDGLDVYNKIKSGGPAASPPVIVLSSLTKEQILSTLSNSDVIDEDSIFSKPIDPMTLISKVEQMLARTNV